SFGGYRNEPRSSPLPNPLTLLSTYSLHAARRGTHLSDHYFPQLSSDQPERWARAGPMRRRQTGGRLLPGRISLQCGLSRQPRPYSPQEPEPKPPELHFARPATVSASPAIQTFHSTSRTYRGHDSGRR